MQYLITLADILSGRTRWASPCVEKHTTCDACYAGHRPASVRQERSGVGEVGWGRKGRKAKAIAILGQDERNCQAHAPSVLITSDELILISQNQKKHCTDASTLGVRPRRVAPPLHERVTCSSRGLIAAVDLFRCRWPWTHQRSAARSLRRLGLSRH